MDSRSPAAAKAAPAANDPPPGEAIKSSLKKLHELYRQGDITEDHLALQNYLPAFAHNRESFSQKMLLPDHLFDTIQNVFHSTWRDIDIGDSHVAWFKLGSDDLDGPFLVNDFVKSRDVRLSDSNVFLEPRQKIEPTGFIFHLGKCRSTFFKHILASRPDNLVISEPEILHHYLFKYQGTSQQQYIRRVIECFSSPFVQEKEKYYIKFVSVCLLEIDRIVECFPDTPALILYRNPADLVASTLVGDVTWMMYPDMISDHVDHAGRNPQTYVEDTILYFYETILGACERYDNIRLLDFEKAIEPVHVHAALEFLGSEVSFDEAEEILGNLKVDSKTGVAYSPMGRPREHVSSFSSPDRGNSLVAAYDRLAASEKNLGRRTSGGRATFDKAHDHSRQGSP